MIPRPTLRETCRCMCMKNDPNAGRSTRVDTAAGVIRGVKIISRESTNDRRYDCLPQAARLYEGVSVRINHQHDDDEADRDAGDILGELRNVRVRADGLYGDLHYLKSHPMARRLAEAAERMPSAFGLSHNVSDWDGHYEGSTYVVTAIHEVDSVDLVADPATTRGLFESRTKKRRGAKSMRLLEWAKKQRPKVRAAVRRLVEAGAMDGATMLDGVSPEASIQQAFQAAAMSVLSDGSDVTAAMPRLKAILKARDDLMASGAVTPSADADAPTEAPPLDDETDADAEDITEEEDDLDDETLDDDGMDDDLDSLADDLLSEDDMGDDDDDDLDALEEGSDLDDDEYERPAESRRKTRSRDRTGADIEQLREENRRLKAEQKARRLCEQQRVQPTPTLLKALIALDSDAERRALLRESRGRTTAGPGRREEESLAEAITREDDDD